METGIGQGQSWVIRLDVQSANYLSRSPYDELAVSHRKTAAVKTNTIYEIAMKTDVWIGSISHSDNAKQTVHPMEYFLT